MPDYWGNPTEAEVDRADAIAEGRCVCPESTIDAVCPVHGHLLEQELAS